jgi:hypothetical protein
MHRVTVKIERVNDLVRRNRPNEPEVVTPELTIVAYGLDHASAIDKAIRHLTTEWNALDLMGRSKAVMTDDDEDEDEEVEPL